MPAVSKIFQVLLYLRGEIEIRKYSRNCAGPRAADCLVGEDAGRAQRRAAAVRAVQLGSELFGPRHSIAEMMTTDVV